MDNVSFFVYSAETFDMKVIWNKDIEYTVLPDINSITIIVFDKYILPNVNRVVKRRELKEHNMILIIICTNNCNLRVLNKWFYIRF